MRLFMTTVVVFITILAVSNIFGVKANNTASDSSVAQVDLTKLKKVEFGSGFVCYRFLTPGWRLADKKYYEGQRTRPFRIYLYRNNPSSLVRIYIRKTSFSPTTIISLVKSAIGGSGLIWKWINHGGENPARVAFSNTNKKTMGFIDARHLPGLWSRILVVSGSWEIQKNKKMSQEFNSLVDSFFYHKLK